LSWLYCVLSGFTEIVMPVRHETTRLSGKGEVALPSSIRHARHWRAGMEFLVEETPEGVLLKPLAAGACEPSRIKDVAGCLEPRRPRASLEEMDAAIAAEVRERYARGRY
jgi:bifunctional DNA-binding transcriptional regulator/antitoxin component of YhaV-PrlF toxin-antitoxin module